MATIKEMADFMGSLPADTRAVLVVQRDCRPLVLRTDTLEIGGGMGPNWPRAVWDGLDSLPPDEDDDGIGEVVGTA